MPGLGGCYDYSEACGPRSVVKTEPAAFETSLLLPGPSYEYAPRNQNHQPPKPKSVQMVPFEDWNHNRPRVTDSVYFVLEILILEHASFATRDSLCAACTGATPWLGGTFSTILRPRLCHLS